MGLAHLAGKRRPLDADAELGTDHVQSLPQPGPQALQVDVADRTSALAGTDQRIAQLARLQADATSLLVLGDD